MIRLPLDRRRARVTLLAGALVFPALAGAPVRAQSRGDGGAAAQATARYLESIRNNPALVAAFLRELPKGADLHHHLSGAVYAETFLRWAAQDSLCIVRATLVAAPPPCDPLTKPSADSAFRNATLYGDIVDAWSMRNWHPARENGHDQFFATFGRFGLAGNNHLADEVVEATKIAADDRVAYIETMFTPEGQSRALARRVGWDADFASLRRKLLDAGFRDAVLGEARATYDSLEAGRARACRDAAAPGCAVTVRYLYQVGRARAPVEVFAQILAGFEVASADARVVGFNLVQPEDDYLAMRDYDLQMRMIQFLRPLYPRVRSALHAGELAPGLVPPEGLRFHVREAVEVAGASRIGHGVDVMHETRPAQLLREMAERRVLVEICLSSNAQILGVTGKEHPLREYIDAGVPVALATDDQGVARSDMTGEYERAVLDQGLGYPQLKAMARASLEHAFIEGASLWSDPRTFVRVSACPAGDVATAACRRFLDASPKARLQWALERDLAAFEAAHAGSTATASGTR